MTIGAGLHSLARPVLSGRFEIAFKIEPVRLARAVGEKIFFFFENSCCLEFVVGSALSLGSFDTMSHTCIESGSECDTYETSGGAPTRAAT